MALAIPPLMMNPERTRYGNVEGSTEKTAMASPFCESFDTVSGFIRSQTKHKNTIMQTAAYTIFLPLDFFALCFWATVFA